MGSPKKSAVFQRSSDRAKPYVPRRHCAFVPRSFICPPSPLCDGRFFPQGVLSRVQAGRPGKDGFTFSFWSQSKRPLPRRAAPPPPRSTIQDSRLAPLFHAKFVSTALPKRGPTSFYASYHIGPFFSKATPAGCRSPLHGRFSAKGLFVFLLTLFPHPGYNKVLCKGGLSACAAILAPQGSI